MENPPATEKDDLAPYSLTLKYFHDSINEKKQVSKIKIRVATHVSM